VKAAARVQWMGARSNIRVMQPAFQYGDRTGFA
jgi:hypothetical protein